MPQVRKFSQSKTKDRKNQILSALAGMRTCPELSHPWRLPMDSSAPVISPLEASAMQAGGGLWPVPRAAAMVPAARRWAGQRLLSLPLELAFWALWHCRHARPPDTAQA